MLIRSETPADVRPISKLLRRVFLLHEPGDGSEARSVAVLRARGALSVSLVAETDGVLAGYVAISPVTISDGTPGWFGLGPLAVDWPWQRSGIGTRLVRAGLELLEARAAGGCVVMGELDYYGRFGFVQLPDLRLGGVPQFFFVARVLRGPQPSGWVTYHAAFAGGSR